MRIGNHHHTVIEEAYSLSYHVDTMSLTKANLQLTTKAAHTPFKVPYLGGMNAPDQSEFTSKLTPRELEVLEAIAAGKSRETIADQLHISKLTYDGYRKNIRLKLNIKNQADWVRVLYGYSLTK